MSHDFLLPRGLRNQVFTMLKDAGLEPAEFEWTKVPGTNGRVVSQLNHVATGFFLTFGLDPYRDFVLNAWPKIDTNRIKALRWPGRIDENHARAMNYTALWVITIAPQIKEPDLWELSGAMPRLSVEATSAADTPFSAEEQQRIAEGLKQLEAFVEQAEPDLPEEKRRSVAARFGYIKAASERLKRLDWTSMFVGQMFAMATEKLITWQTFMAIYSMAATAFGHVLSAGAAAAKFLGN